MRKTILYCDICGNCASTARNFYLTNHPATFDEIKLESLNEYKDTHVDICQDCEDRIFVKKEVN